MNETGSLELLWRRKHLLVVGALLGVAVAILVGSPAKVIAVDRYQARDALILNPDVATPEQANRYAFLASSSEVPSKVAETLPGYDSDADVLEQVVVQPDPVLGNVVLTTEGHSSAGKAEELLTTFGDELMAFLATDAQTQRAAQIERVDSRLEAVTEEVKALQAQGAGAAVGADGQAVAPDPLLAAELSAAVADYSQLRQQMSELQEASAANEQPLERLRPVVAELEATPDSGDPLGALGRIAIGGIVGLALGAALAFLIHRFDSRLYSKTDVEEAFQLPVIAEIPKLPRRWRKQRGLVTLEEPASSAAESFRQLRSTLSAIHNQRMRRLAQAPEPISGTRDEMIVLVASPGPGDGKSTTLANLAKAFVDAGQSVVVVSGDLRRPSMHEFLQADESPGLSEAIQEGLEPGRVGDLVRPTVVTGIQLLPHGEPVDNPGELLAASRGLILAARDLADVVLIDSPPVLVGNDVSELVPVADGILLVARVGRTTAEQAHRAKEAIDRLAAPVLGVVLVGSDELMRQGSYYSTYYGRQRQTWRTRVFGELALRREHFGRKPRRSAEAAPEGQPGIRPTAFTANPAVTVPAQGGFAPSPGEIDEMAALDQAVIDVDGADVGDGLVAETQPPPVVAAVPQPLASAPVEGTGGSHVPGAGNGHAVDHGSDADADAGAGVDLRSLRRRVLMERRHRSAGTPPDSGPLQDDDGPA